VTTTFEGGLSPLDASASVRLAAIRLRRERGMWRRLTFELSGPEPAWCLGREADAKPESLAAQVPCWWRSASSDQLAAAPQRRHDGWHEARQVAASLHAKHKGGGLVERGVVTVADQCESSRLGEVTR
jgi:hypothetical protein